MKNPKEKSEPGEVLLETANALASELNADIALYSGGIDLWSAHDLIEKCNSRQRRPNIF